MDRNEEASDEAFDTFSLSDFHIYSDPSCSSKEEQHNGDSFSSFRFKIANSLPSEEIAFLRRLISLRENDHKPSHQPPNPSRMKTYQVQDKVLNLAPVRSQRRKTKRGFLMFGLGGSPPRMEGFESRSKRSRAGLPRIVPLNSTNRGVEEVITNRGKSGNWLAKLFGACIPGVELAV